MGKVYHSKNCKSLSAAAAFQARDRSNAPGMTFGPLWGCKANTGRYFRFPTPEARGSCAINTHLTFPKDGDNLNSLIINNLIGTSKY